MNEAMLILNIANLALIGALPRIFFRPGRLNIRWWITAAPFFLTAAALCAGMMGLLEPKVSSVGADAAAVLASSSSILLIGLTLGTHREPLSLWHQEDDLPSRIVTTGPYRRIRHPFYAAFMLALGAATAGFPHWITVLCTAFGVVQLNRTAAREEKRLLASHAGEEYALYRERTGRFVPSLRRRGIEVTPVGRRAA